MKKIRLSLISIGISTIIVLIIYKASNVFIFGTNSIGIYDANIQYYDFFGYFYNILHGKDSAFFSFNNGLGESTTGLIAYYLTSPLNLLLYLFPKDQIPFFYDFLYLCKVGLASAFFSWYLSERFSGKIPSGYNVLISVSFSLMQYSLEQAPNIIWLDGLYMLPLVALGIYKLVKNESWVYLAVTFGLTIIFNWYIGGVIGLFSIFWVIIEFFINVKNNYKSSALRIFWKFILAMALGVGLSAFIFLPTVITLLQGKGGSLELRMLLDYRQRGNLLDLIYNYRLGAYSSSFSPALYTGSFTLICSSCIFFSSRFSLKQKIISLIIVTFSISILFNYNLFILFSLLKVADTYYSRYGLISLFCLCFLAAWFISKKNFTHPLLPLKVAVFYAIIIASVYYFKNGSFSSLLLLTLLGFIFNGFFLYLQFSGHLKNTAVISALAVFCTVCELSLNGYQVISSHSNYNVYESYKEYEKGIEELLDLIPADYSGRINQVSYRIQDPRPQIHSDLNEGLNYGFKSIAAYTSMARAATVKQLDYLGYALHVSIINSVSTPILPSESLMGVEYILSPYGVPGLEMVQSSDLKNLYFNPYALPIDIMTNNLCDNIQTESTFEYVNQVYREISGLDEDIFKKVKYDQNDFEFTVHSDPGIGPLYMDIKYSDPLSKYVNLYVDDELWIYYLGWLSSDVIYVPQHSNTVKINLSSDELTDVNKLSPIEFYQADLSVLKEMKTVIMSRQKDNSIEMNNGKIFCNVETEDEYLALTVPYDKGWTATVNGQKVEVKPFMDGFMAVPLQDGQNTIVLTYSQPGLVSGGTITLASLLLIIISCFKSRNYQHHKQI